MAKPPFVYGPTFEEMRDPARISPTIRARALTARDANPLDPINLFNITWKDSNGSVRHVVLPPALTGVDATIAVISGKWFPTGSHKVGATYSCTIERQVMGKILPGKHRLVWPSTGNYAIGGAFVGPRMGYRSLAVLPERVSRERFERIVSYGAEYIATPGCESNVKEIYDKTHELEREPDTVIVNQFAEMGNYRFHYSVTGNSILELVDDLKGQGVVSRLAAFCSAMGSSGTIGAGDRLKQVVEDCLVVGIEPIQCPTLFNNGFGDHDIQGIGDKHVTWIHHTDTMDALLCVDDVQCKKGLQLLAEEEGWRVLSKHGVTEPEIKTLSSLFGISGICNVLGAIKIAKFFRLGKGDLIVTVATDHLDRYYSVLAELTEMCGRVDEAEALRRLATIFHDVGTDWVRKGTPHAKDCWHNLKYYTWVEQQGKTVEELRAQRSSEYWLKEQSLIPEIDKRIRAQRGF